jgi:hypothetical protein
MFTQVADRRAVGHKRRGRMAPAAASRTQSGEPAQLS